MFCFFVDICRSQSSSQIRSGKKKAYTALLQGGTFLCRKKWEPQRQDFGGRYGFLVFIGFCICKRPGKFFSWWTFRIFFIFFVARGRGKGSPRNWEGGGRFFIENPRGGVSRAGGGRGARGWVFAGKWGGGGANFFFFTGRNSHQVLRSLVRRLTQRMDLRERSGVTCVNLHFRSVGVTCVNLRSRPQDLRA